MIRINNFKQRLKKSLIAIFCYWLIMSAILYFAADFIIFKPSKNPTKLSDILEISSKAEIKEIYNKDNEIINAFFIPQESDKIFVYFHGNAGYGIDIVIDKFLQKTNLNILVAPYLGYYPSTGKASEKNFYLSADKIMEYLINNGWQEEDIIIMGSSLGGAAVTYIASKYPNLNRTIIVNTFNSIYAMCLEEYYIFCIFTKDIINSSKYAKNIDGKILQFHSPIDETVPYKLGKKLFNDIKSQDKKFFDLYGNHSDFSFDQIIELSQL